MTTEQVGMTLDEAMTDLSIQLEVKRRLGQDHQADAIKLGIEGLKRVKYYQRLWDTWHLGPLAGETRE